jgi:hypothetical protein
LPVGKKEKNIIDTKLIFGVSVFPAYGRQASSVPIRKENKATGAIVDVHLKDQQDK